MYPFLHKMDTKFKTIFATQIRAIEPTEETRNEAKASLGRLKDLLPPGLDPQDEPALLFVAGNLAVAGMINLNDDGVDLETGLAIYKGFEKQPIDLEHNRKSVVGYIIHAGLTEFGSDRVITEDEARESGKPFNIAIIIALWKVVDKDLCSYILQASNPMHPDFKALSLSFEVGFENYRIVVLPKGDYRITDAHKTVSPEDADFAKYDALLRANKGDGFAPESKDSRVYRVLTEGVIPLGGGIVTMPAAAVKGLIALLEPNNTTALPDADEPEETEEEVAARIAAEEAARVFEDARNSVSLSLDDFEKKIAASIISHKTRVSSDTLKTITLSNMEKPTIQSLKERAEKATEVKELQELFASVTEIAASAVDDAVTKAITDESVRREQARIESESQAAKLEQAKVEAEAATSELKKHLDSVKAELDEMKKKHEQAEADSNYQARMSAVDATFDLTDEDRAALAPDIKNMNHDEFPAWMDKHKKLMHEKTHDHKKAKIEEAKKEHDQFVQKLQEKGIKAKITDSGIEIEQALASATTNQTTAPIENIVKPLSDLKEMAAKAFADSVTIGGRKLETLKKK